MTYRELAQRIRVPAGFVLAPLLFILADSTWRTLLAGSLVAVTGLLIRAWASGYLRKNEELTMDGPYSFTRNPLYFGTFLLALGVAIASGSTWFLLLLMMLYLAIYCPVILAEADTMRRMFPEGYAQYSSQVPMFLPRLTPYRPLTGSRFDLALYFKHREYQAGLGFAVILLLLAAKQLLMAR
jgi:protein-S-isoprenylcysteine O-methyltransferase Ste14